MLILFYMNEKFVDQLYSNMEDPWSSGKTLAASRGQSSRWVRALNRAWGLRHRKVDRTAMCCSPISYLWYADV
jgi:hypothetical protein